MSGDMLPCPKCGSEFVSVASSRDLGVSEIQCSDCGFTLQKNVPEECIERLWKRLDRSRMPRLASDDHTGPFPSLESHPYEYRLRYPSTDSDMWAPARASDLDRLLTDPCFQVRRRSHDFDMKDLAVQQRKEAAHVRT
jgi:hypothetical protein